MTMVFGSPLFLIGAAAAAIPVIIHILFRKKARKQQFPSLLLIKMVKKRVTRYHRIRELILLMLRIAVIVFLALALARPLIPGFGHDSDTVIVFVIDDSLSMGRICEGVSLFESGIQNLLTPRLVPRLGYCDYNCTACSQICPSGAIPLLSLEGKQSTPIGLARVDTNRCLPWAYQTTCIVCEEACPLPEKAIWLIDEEVEDANGNKILLRKPQVDRTLCIGCGVCEYQCPMGGEGAIRVFTPTETGVYPI